MDSPNEALLVMDVQAGILDRLATKEDYVAELKKTIDHAHKKGIPVIYVVVGFRTGFPEVSNRNKSFSNIKNAKDRRMNNPVPFIEPIEGDVTVVKRRVSAFSGSDLEIILRALEIDRLVLTGIATSGVVLSTAREAADKDYEVTILSDLCADFDSEVHTVLINKVLPRQANIITSHEWALGR
jgi:nicotinamidase-related amidase